jgi:hypothetical protein
MRFPSALLIHCGAAALGKIWGSSAEIHHTSIWSAWAHNDLLHPVAGFSHCTLNLIYLAGSDSAVTEGGGIGQGLIGALSTSNYGMGNAPDGAAILDGSTTGQLLSTANHILQRHGISNMFLPWKHHLNC